MPEKIRNDRVNMDRQTGLINDKVNIYIFRCATNYHVLLLSFELVRKQHFMICQE